MMVKKSSINGDINGCIDDWVILSLNDTNGVDDAIYWVSMGYHGDTFWK
jgi:hypothetical protein